MSVRGWKTPRHGWLSVVLEEVPLPAKKTARVQERKRVINRRVRSTSRTAVKKAVSLLADRDPQAGGAVMSAVSTLDRAAQKGVIHPNAAARRKSRLMRRLNSVAAK